ncbi:hypothetical protein PTKIN_Ptkin04bG0036100 [Pterospermum kingtungense]
MELQQCYKALSRLSEQLVVEVADSRALKSCLREKETTIAELEKELNETRINAHEGGCASILFEYSSGKLISGGQDRSTKMWDTSTGSLSHSLFGCLGSVLDLAITHDSRFIIAASCSNNLFVWDVNSGRVRYTLTGRAHKVCAVDVSKVSSRHVASAAYDRTIKVWDLQKGRVEGNLCLWDIQTGKLLSEVAAHSLAITSISRNGSVVSTSGRDNLHDLFDIRSLEACGTFRATGNRMASNWSRPCISPDTIILMLALLMGPSTFGQ